MVLLGWAGLLFVLSADGHIRRCQSLDVSIQREHFPLKSDEPVEFNCSSIGVLPLLQKHESTYL